MEYCATALTDPGGVDSQKLSGFVYENISDDEEMETKPFHVIEMANTEFSSPLHVMASTGMEKSTPLDSSQCSTNMSLLSNSSRHTHFPVCIPKKESDFDTSSTNTEKTLDICQSIFPNVSDVDSANECSLSLQNVCCMTESPNSSLSEEVTGNHMSPVIKVCGEIKNPARKKRRRRNKTHARVTPKKSKKKKIQEEFVFEIANDTAEMYSFKSEYVFDGAYGSKTNETVAGNVEERNQNMFDVRSPNCGNLGTQMETSRCPSTLPFEIAPPKIKKRGRPKKSVAVTATATSTSSASEDFEDPYTKMTAEEQQQIIGFRIADEESSETTATASVQLPPGSLSMSEKKREKKSMSKKNKCPSKQIKIEHDASLSDLPTKPPTKRGRPKKSKLKSTFKGRGRPPVIGQFKCDRCELVFQDRPKLLQHRKTHVKPFIYCSYCDFKARSRGAFLEHESRHTKAKPFKCELCQYASRSRIDLQRHQAKHSKVKNYKCPYCDFTTKWRRNVSSHLLSHVEDRPFHCEICGHSFKRPCDLKYHLYRHTSAKPLRCKECGFRCKTNYELNLHQFKHSDVRPFPCTHPGCQQACKTKSDLTKHMHVHSEERKFPCPLCGKCFKSPSARNKHAQRHTDERPFTCNICNKTFKVKSSLGKHMPLHSGIRPFSCDVCDRTFSNKSNKRAHMKTHDLADRPYRCPLCPYGGKTQQNLLAHVGTMHGNYAFFCELCKKPYKRHSQLQLHYKRMHSKKELDKLENLDSLDMTLIKGEEDGAQNLSHDEGTSEYQSGINCIMKQIKQESKNDEDSATSSSRLESLDMKQDFASAVGEKRKRGRPRKKVNTKLSPCKKARRKRAIDCESTEDSGDGERQSSRNGETSSENHQEKLTGNGSGPIRKKQKNSKSQQNSESVHSVENSQSKISENTSQSLNKADTVDTCPIDNVKRDPSTMADLGGCLVDTNPSRNSISSSHRQDEGSEIQLENKDMRQIQRENSAKSHSVDTSTSKNPKDNGLSGHMVDKSKSGQLAYSVRSGNIRSSGSCSDYGFDNSPSQQLADASPSGNSINSTPSRCGTDNDSKKYLEDKSTHGDCTDNEEHVDTCTSVVSTDTQSRHLTDEIQNGCSLSNSQSGHSADQSSEDIRSGISPGSSTYRCCIDNGSSSHFEDGSVITDISLRELKEKTTDNLLENHKESAVETPCSQGKALDKMINTQSHINIIEESRVEESNDLPSDFDLKDGKTEQQRNENDTQSNAQTNVEQSSGDTVVRGNSSHVENSVSFANLHDSGRTETCSSKVQETQLDTNSLNNIESKQFIHVTENMCGNGLQKSGAEDQSMKNPDFTRICTAHDNEDRQKVGIKTASDAHGVETLPVSHNLNGESEIVGSCVSSEICPPHKDGYQAVDCNETQGDSSKRLPLSSTGDQELRHDAEQKPMSEIPDAKNANAHSTWTKFDDNFRLPLAKKGFQFNFRKTGKKPKCWFMELDAMDEEAQNLQFKYLCRKAGLASTSRVKGKKRQVTVADQRKRKRKKLINACRQMSNKSKHRSSVQPGPTLTNISMDFIKEWKNTIGSPGIGRSSLDRAYKPYTSRLDGKKVSKEDLCKLNKSEGTMLKPKLSIVSNEVSESCMQKVKSISMTSRKLPFKKKYIKLEIDEEGRCIDPPQGNCPNEQTTGNGEAGKINERQEMKYKVGINSGNGLNDEEPDTADTNKNLSEIEVDRGEFNMQQEFDGKEAGQGLVLQTDDKMHTSREKHEKGAIGRKSTSKKKALKSGMKRTTTREESDSPDDSVDPPETKPNEADYISLKRKLREKIRNRNVESKPKSNALVCSLDPNGQMVMKTVDEFKTAKKRILVNNKSRQCKVCMRDVLFGRDNDTNSGEVTCPSCELDCKLSSEFKANHTENRYEKLDLRSDSEESDEGELFSKNVYVVKPPANKPLVSTAATCTPVVIGDVCACKPQKTYTGHIKTYVVSKEMDKEASHELTDVRANVVEYTGKTAETASQNQKLKTVPESEESAETKPNIEYFEFQVHDNSQDDSSTELETAQVPKDSSNFEIRMDYPQVKKEMDIQCHKASGNGINTTNKSALNNSGDTLNEPTITNMKQSENFTSTYFCAGTLMEDANTNNNNMRASGVSKERVKNSSSKEDTCEGSDQETDTNIYVYCDDVKAMRLPAGKVNDGQSAKDILWNDPCVKTVVEDLGNDTRFVNGQVENITVANYLGQKVKIEKEEELHNEVPDLVDDPVMQSFSRDTSVMRSVNDHPTADVTQSVSTDTKPLPIYHMSDGDMKYHVQETQNQGSEDNTSTTGEEPAQCLPIILDVRSIKQEPDFDGFV